jgi:ubiquitin C-terminal hydrolase
MTTVKDVQRPKKWRHLPSSQCRENGYCGIVNLGCICYMISVM